jgi:hypothetical protein
MKWITTRIKQFIIGLIVDDIKRNGLLAQQLRGHRFKSATESLQEQRSAAIFGQVASVAQVPGPVKVGSAFKEGTKLA